MTTTAPVTLQMLGDDAVACVGDSCAIPSAQQVTTLVNDLVDTGEI
jgi:hypothetical protein